MQYRFRQNEIDEMKRDIIAHCESEREQDRHGNKSAWRLRLVLEAKAWCCKCSKREKARRERKIALYESLTHEDMPNFKNAVK